jgi:hypothetical protein
MSEAEEFGDNTVVLLQRIARELTTIRQLATTAITYIRDAESEIPEKYRRFVNAFHDVHHIGWVYEEKGIPIPQHVRDELERLDDRYRQILSVLNSQGDTFEKVRREMAADPMNRWDHTKQLPGPTHIQEKKDETGTS